MSNEGFLLRADGLVKTYTREGKALTVLKGVDLKIARGEMLAIVGPSGAGKSTLLHILGTLDSPSSGKVIVDGQDVTYFEGAELATFRNRKLGFVFQFHHLLPEFSALENILMPAFIAGDRSKETKQRATELLREVGLADRSHHRPTEMSGGEQQRVALCRSLINRPLLVLADEPTGNLDSKTGGAIKDLLFRFNQKYETAFAIVTHSRELAATMPRTIGMRDGRIESDASMAMQSTIESIPPTLEASFRTEA